jgi:formylglycine-generating enzyme required for sulfatase activity
LSHSSSPCPVCTQEKSEREVCPRCGYDPGVPPRPNALPAGTRLFHGAYTLAHPLGEYNGSGIVYRAWHDSLKLSLAIKEYLPFDLAARAGGREVRAHAADERWPEGLEHFRAEARTLAEINHPGIVAFRGFFQENGTGYLVMKHYEGEGLDHVLSIRGRLPEDEARSILLPVLEALEFLHARNHLHRDVKPSNIFLRRDGGPLLLDFGTARRIPTEATTTFARSAGYSALELYTGGRQGAWTDVYAATATLYHLVTGQRLPEAPRRLSQDKLLAPDRLKGELALSAPLCRALAAGLALDLAQRPQTVAQLRGLLLARPDGARKGPEILVRQPEPQAGEVRKSDKDGLEYVFVPPGRFEMGTVAGDAEASQAERPPHAVLLPRGFWLSTTPVTVAAYRRFVEATRRPLPAAPEFNLDWCKHDHPMVEVSWQEARSCCEWAGGRLPTEAEWERAARGGVAGKRYPWGDDAPSHHLGSRHGARFGSEKGGPVAVASYAANGYGLFDMAGNVWEWCEDVWHPSHDDAPDDGGAWLRDDSPLRVLRGGSWGDVPWYLRSSSRYRDTSGSRSADVGFRCLRDLLA